MPRLELRLLKPNEPPKMLDLEGDVITMGRARECTIRIEDRFLSRQHAEIVSERGAWVLRDKGSVNGTFLNGARIGLPVTLKTGDQIEFGHTKLIVGGAAADEVQMSDSAPVTQFTLSEHDVRDSTARSSVIHRLALELIEDRSMEELFDLILDRVVDIMQPSRAALALLEPDGESLKIVKVRRTAHATQDLTISRTLTREVIRERKVLAFTDVDPTKVYAAAESFAAQAIYSAVCAPLVTGDSVHGLLYIDYQSSRRQIREDDAQLAAQIARVAAIKLESTQLRKAAQEKDRLEEALNLARAIQMRMLPRQLPATGAGFDIAAEMLPAKQVGGDFYDYHLSGDGRLFFCIGDVSGKGVPAALMMAVSRALFRSFILAGRTPGEIAAAVNRQLCDETDDTMFVTAFCGVLDLATGELRYVNAGHHPPLVVSRNGTVRPLPTTPGLVLGYLPQFAYREESGRLQPDDLLFLYTDGISEATNAEDELFGGARVESILRASSGADAREVTRRTLEAVQAFAGSAPQSDDLTLLVVRWLGRAG